MDNEADSSGIEHVDTCLTQQEPQFDRIVRAAIDARASTGELLPEMRKEEARRFFFGRPVEVIRVEDVNDELLELIMNAKYGEVSA